MSKRTQYSTGATWEPIVGYARAVRAGNIIEVSGTCAVDANGHPVAIGDMYGQAKRILEIIQTAIEHVGGSMQDVVRTRMFVTDISRWEEAGRAHGEVFGAIRPVTTMVEVSRLIAPEYLIEIEATAIVLS
jgi:enamine deaminase RidA (YjgF/YER057c/UK114 family)